jgi:hypothetical protein
VEREVERYRDGDSRLPGIDDAQARQRQLVRMANAALGAGLAHLMNGDTGPARQWFALAADRYRESFPPAPPGSWGRPIGAMKARILAGDWVEAATDAEWALEQRPEDADSPIGRYAACLAFLVLGRDTQARFLADELRTHDGFPSDVGDALACISAQDPIGYIEAIESVLASFEGRSDFLEDVPVADTVVVLQALAARRDLAAELSSPLLPRSA